MVLPIVKYGNPVLRKKGAAVGPITDAIRELSNDLLETMYAAAGIGLAAQQVGQALQIAVVDVRAVQDRPSTLQVDGKSVDLALFMPMVLIDPQLKPLGDLVAGPEGCLSFPEIYEEITRPESVEVKATNLTGERLHFVAGGLLARVIQHECDHLNGILFIDRMPTKAKQAIKPELEELQTATKAALGKSPVA